MERKDLNEFLLARGGYVNSQILDDKRPLYQLVWSNGELELRHGTFCEYHDNTFIREVTETRWTRKYPHINERWILERWIPPELVATNKELVNARNGSYEPIYVFEDGNRFYLEPNIKVLNFILDMAEKPHHITQTELMNKLIDKEEKEVLAIAEAMEYRSDIGVALQLKEAIGYTGKVN